MTTLQLPTVPRKVPVKRNYERRKRVDLGLIDLGKSFDDNTIPLYIGDNLATMKGMESESIDCIYADPPYNTKRSWETLQSGQFDDSWWWDKDLGGVSVLESFRQEDLGRHGDLIKALPLWIDNITSSDRSKSTAAYIAFMVPRVYHMWRLLKETGIMYLHVSSKNVWALTAVCDAIFGEENRMSTLIWRNSTPKESKKFIAVYDSILMYAKKFGTHIWNRQAQTLSESQLAKFKHEDEHGRFAWQSSFTKDAIADLPEHRRLERRQIKLRGRYLWQEYQGVRDMGVPFTRVFEPLFAEHFPEGLDRQPFDDRLALYDSLGLLQITKSSVLQYKRYLVNSRGTPVPDIIPDDVAPYVGFHHLVSGQDKEAWRTQKPPKLLKVLMEAVTVEGDTVFDPFMGSGTTLAVAHTLGRRAVGADIQDYATQLIPVLSERLPEYWNKQYKDDFPDNGQPELVVSNEPPVRKTLWNEGGSTSAAKAQWMKKKQAT